MKIDRSINFISRKLYEYFREAGGGADYVPPNGDYISFVGSRLKRELPSTITVEVLHEPAIKALGLLELAGHGVATLFAQAERYTYRAAANEPFNEGETSIVAGYIDPLWELMARPISSAHDEIGTVVFRPGHLTVPPVDVRPLVFVIDLVNRRGLKIVWPKTKAKELRKLHSEDAEVRADRWRAVIDEAAAGTVRKMDLEAGLVQSEPPGAGEQAKRFMEMKTFVGRAGLLSEQTVRVNPNHVRRLVIMGWRLKEAA